MRQILLIYSMFKNLEGGKHFLFSGFNHMDASGLVLGF